ncbi:MAG TPA: L-rhamnose isomerase [Lacipirellulaceae bacterium]|nr:L-rhamnose isomerase [Lacipirellulaceae bacterium]
MKASVQQIERNYHSAKDCFGEIGIDADRALQRLQSISISLQCWQGDDVRGFEGACEELGGGLAVTGNYPGSARNADELRQDLEMALRLIPGRHRVNLHAMYAECGDQAVERTNLEPKHFERWIDWAKSRCLGLDFNPTYFAHRLASSGLTLCHPDDAVRSYWIEHGIVCRRIGAAIGRALNSTCITNLWIPDGAKDTPIDRKTPRERLRQSLDAIFAEKLDRRWNLDAVESKLFGIGSESYVVGSHEFYLGYAIENDILMCLDMGHFHPTESVGDKVSAILAWIDQILLHVSRGVRWDSDHIPTLNDDVRAVVHEVVRGNYLDRAHIALDYFDATINRVAAWVIGARATLLALLYALLEPVEILRQYEAAGDLTARLATLEFLKNLPLGAVWDYYCITSDVPPGISWLSDIRQYEKELLSRR